MLSSIPMPEVGWVQIVSVTSMAGERIGDSSEKTLLSISKWGDGFRQV